MSWHETAYFVGVTISFVALIWVFGGQAAKKKRALAFQKSCRVPDEYNRATERDIERAEMSYAGSLAGLFFGPLTLSWIWPGAAMLAIIVAIVFGAGWLLDKGVSIFMKESSE